jgi:polyisoprenoid-binding protein YceI
MTTNATISPLIATYSADPDHSSIAFALRHMSVATFHGASCVEVRAV